MDAHLNKQKEESWDNAVPYIRLGRTAEQVTGFYLKRLGYANNTESRMFECLVLSRHHSSSLGFVPYLLNCLLNLIHINGYLFIFLGMLCVHCR
uniref:tRNA-synt_1g domain-containing protein n=1 Tax=Caenorhabditis tropicalis TaxID=1561998 RepID=A0A1I7U071_9PELO